MRQCPKCNRAYAEDSLNFCLDDGSPLASSDDPEATLVFANSTPVTELSPLKPSSSHRSYLLRTLVISLFVISAGTLGGFMFWKKSWPPINAFEARFTTGPSATTVSVTNKAAKDLHEVNVVVTIIGDDGQSHSEKKYFALWSNNQINYVTFSLGDVHNVQKVTMVGSCTEGSIDYAGPNPPPIWDEESDYIAKEGARSLLTTQPNKALQLTGAIACFSSSLVPSAWMLNARRS